MSRRVLVAPTIALLALVLGGCGAAQTAATAQNRPSVPGVNVTESGIGVRNAMVEPSVAGYPAGGDAPIALALVNQTPEPVRLIGVSSEGARSVTLTEAVLVGQTAGATQPPAGQPVTDLELAPGGFYALTLQAAGLRHQLTGTGSIDLELAFDNDRVINLTVPVAPPSAAPPRGEPIDTGH